MATAEADGPNATMMAIANRIIGGNVAHPFLSAQENVQFSKTFSDLQVIIQQATANITSSRQKQIRNEFDRLITATTRPVT